MTDFLISTHADTKRYTVGLFSRKNQLLKLHKLSSSDTVSNDRILGMIGEYFTEIERDKDSHFGGFFLNEQPGLVKVIDGKYHHKITTYPTNPEQDLYDPIDLVNSGKLSISLGLSTLGIKKQIERADAENMTSEVKCLCIAAIAHNRGILPVVMADFGTNGTQRGERAGWEKGRMERNAENERDGKN